MGCGLKSAPTTTKCMSSSSQPPSSTSSSPEDGPSSSKSTLNNSSETRFFNRWRRTFSEVTGMGLSDEQWADVVAERQRKRCFKMRDDLITYSKLTPSLLLPLLLTQGSCDCARSCCCLHARKDREGDRRQSQSVSADTVPTMRN